MSNNETVDIPDNCEYDEEYFILRKSDAGGKIRSICVNWKPGDEIRWYASGIDASVPLDDIEIHPKSYVMIVGEASVEKYCAICCKAVACGVRMICVAYGEKMENLESVELKTVYHADGNSTVLKDVEL